MINLVNLLKENEEDGLKSLKTTYDLALTSTTTPIDDLIAALEDLDNYGIYASNQINSNADIRQAVVDFFGPSGGNSVKIAAATKSWNTGTPNYRLRKKQDILSRLSGFDGEGWENMSFKSLPKEARNPNVFYPLKTKQAIDDYVKSLSKGVSILNWVVEDNMIVFPFKENPAKDVTRKIIKTVFDKAGITDFKFLTKETEVDGSDSGEKTTITKKADALPLTTTLDFEEDAKELRDILKKKFSINNAKYDIVPEEDTIKLIVTGITPSQRAQMQQVTTQYIQDLMEGKEFKRMQKLAGI